MVFVGIIEKDPGNMDNIVRFFSKKESYSLLFACLSFDDYRKVPFSKKRKAAIIFTGKNEDSFSCLLEVSYLKQLNTASRVVVLSDEYDESIALRIAKCGAAGFVKKPFTHLVLENCVNEIIGGNIFFPQVRQQDKINEILLSHRSHDDNNLSLREFEIIELIRKGYTNKQIGTLLCISHHTVNSHLKKIFLKFNVNSRARLVNKIIEFYQ
jgi:DNA-binding NarL/FixJ family response regulator